MTRIGFVLNNLTRRKRLRAAFTVASIAATLFGLTLLLSIVNTIESGFRKSIAPRVIVHSATSLAVFLPYTHATKLATVPGVKAVLPWTWFGGVWKDPKYFFPQFSTEPRGVPAMYPEYRFDPKELDDWARDRAGCAIGDQLAARYGLKVGDRMFIKGTIYPVQLELTVRAIMKRRNPDDNTGVLLFQRDYLEELSGRTGRVGSFWLLLNSADDVAPVMRAVDQMFYNSDHETKTETERAFQLQFISMLGNIRAMALFVGVLAVVSILLIVGNTMAMSARERTGEVAVLKTLGFPPGQVLAILLSESLGLAVIGGLLGIGAAAGLTPAFQKAAEYAPFLQGYRVAPAVLALVSGVTLFVGFASGCLPAWAASRIHVVEGLRKVV